MGQAGSTVDGWLCTGNRDICAAARQGEKPSGSPRELAAPDPAEESAVLECVARWLSLREAADADGCAALSTPDIVVRTPMGIVTGLDGVRAHVYSAASPHLTSHTAPVASAISSGVYSVSRFYVVSKAGTDFRLRQEWLVLSKSRQTIATARLASRRVYEPLIAEVRSSIA